jgi:hypothetical protein
VSELHLLVDGNHFHNTVHCVAPGAIPMKFIFWRGNSLYCRYPFTGKPERYPLGIYRASNCKTENARCIRLGEEKLTALRAQQALKGTLFEKITEPKAHQPYNPKFWRLVGRYWHNHLRFQKSGKIERYHLAHSLKAFGEKFAKDITREEIENWRQAMKAHGASINAINLRFAYLRAAYHWSRGETIERLKLGYDPTAGMKKLPGAKVRTFVLTKEKFERNYRLLKNGDPVFNIPGEPRFALFYLALWETMRRPFEVAQYTWEMVSETEIDGKPVRVFAVPPEIAKTNDYSLAVISDRLWSEMSKLAYRSGNIFRNTLGRPWADWKQHKEKLKAAFGSDAGWIRDCRRGGITHRAEVEGCDPAHIKMQSGHKTSSVFERYRIGNIRNQAAVVGVKIRPNSGQNDDVGVRKCAN